MKKLITLILAACFLPTASFAQYASPNVKVNGIIKPIDQWISDNIGAISVARTLANGAVQSNGGDASLTTITASNPSGGSLATVLTNFLNGQTANAAAAAAAQTTANGAVQSASPVFTIGNGAIRNTTQPANAFIDLFALNDGSYHDNVLTIENDSQDPVTGVYGNAAIRFRDPITHYERGAMGYGTFQGNGVFSRHLYAEIGNIGPPGDMNDTSFSIVNTHSVGAANFPSTQYSLLEVRGDTGNIYVRDHQSRIGMVWSEGDHSLAVNGTANGLSIVPGAASAPVSLIAQGADALVLLRMDDKGGAGSALASNGNYGLLVQNPASAVNYMRGYGSATGTPVGVMAQGQDQNILLRLEDKGSAGVALASNGTYSLLAGPQVVQAFHPVQSYAIAFAGLPPCNATYQYSQMVVTDATAWTPGSAVAGGGGYVLPVFCDGRGAWKVS